MRAVLSFLSGIGEAVAGAFAFLWSFLQDIVYMVQLTGRLLAQIPSFFSWLPPELLALIVTALTLYVVLRIIGRG